MTEKLYWEKPWQSDGEDVIRVENRSGMRRNSFHKNSMMSPDTKESIDSKLRRSLSFSSPSSFRDQDELNISFIDLTGESPSKAPPDSEHSITSACLTSERLPKFEKHDLSAQRTHTTLSLNQNKFLDLYMDGEQQGKANNQINPPNNANGGCLVENRVLVNSGCPPLAHRTAPTSLTYSKDKPRSQSFNDDKGMNVFSIQNSEVGESRRKFPQKIRKKFVRKSSRTRTLGRRSEMSSRDYDSETTTTVEDIYEDTSDLRQGLYSDGHGSIFNRGASYNRSTNKSTNDYCSRNSLSSEVHHIWNVENEEDTVKDLTATLKEAEERVKLMSEIKIVPEKIENGMLCMSTLLKMIKDVNRERKSLAEEVLIQVQHRIAERTCSRNAMKQANIDFDSRLQRLEKEKSQLQSRLENEPDRRSTDWSFKFEKFQAEESRLRDRVRELAEQNFSLQREVSSLSEREMKTQNRIMNLERQLNDLTERLEDVKTENQKFQQALFELRERSKSVQADRDFIATSYRIKEEENKELQSIVVKFQRICSEHEKTISGLRQTCTTDIVKQSPPKDDLVSQLQLEQIRLCGVEQTLRKEAESYRKEMETVKHENSCLLDRLQNYESGCQSFFRLEHEMSARLKCLQDQGLSLICQNYELCKKLLDTMKSQQVKQDIDTEFGGYYIVEYNAKFEGLKRGIENFKRSLHTLSVVLDEKSRLEAAACQSRPSGIGVSEKWTSPKFQDTSIELELKAESLLTKVLREKLCSQVLEIEQLREDLASTLRGKEKLNEEIRRLEDELYTLSHKAKDMEIQMVMKDGNLNKLKQDFDECTKELDINRDALTKVSKDRDVLWEDVKRLEIMKMQLEHMVESSKQKIESLEEDILLKEGQITIWKDSVSKQSSGDRYTWNAH